MFEMMFLIMFLGFMIVFLMLSKKIRVHFEKQEDLKQKELIALVNIDKQLENLNHNLFIEFEEFFKK